MSYVTNVLLLTSCAEADDNTERYPAVEDLNNRLLSDDMVTFEPIPLDMAGGKKHMEICLFAAAFTYFDEGILAAHAAGVDWRNPDCVQIIVKDQHDPCFWKLFGGSLEGWR